MHAGIAQHSRVIKAIENRLIDRLRIALSTASTARMDAGEQTIRNATIESGLNLCARESWHPGLSYLATFSPGREGWGISALKTCLDRMDERGCAILISNGIRPPDSMIFLLACDGERRGFNWIGNGFRSPSSVPAELLQVESEGDHLSSTIPTVIPQIETDRKDAPKTLGPDIDIPPRPMVLEYDDDPEIRDWRTLEKPPANPLDGAFIQTMHRSTILPGGPYIRSPEAEALQIIENGMAWRDALIVAALRRDVPKLRDLVIHPLISPAVRSVVCAQLARTLPQLSEDVSFQLSTEATSMD